MTTYIKVLFCVLLLTVTSCSTGPDYSVFEKVKIDKTTKFYFLGEEGTPTDFEYKRGDFVISDSTLQRKMIDTWKLQVEPTIHACGSSYGIYILWGDTHKKVVGINSECRTIYVDGRLLKFDPKLFEQIDSTTTVKVSRQTRDSIRDIFRH